MLENWSVSDLKRKTSEENRHPQKREQWGKLPFRDVTQSGPAVRSPLRHRDSVTVPASFRGLMKL